KQYGFAKFIVVVPSAAIREGAHKPFQTTAEHFAQSCDDAPARCFLYDGKKLSNTRLFAAPTDIEIMIFDIDAFNKVGKRRQSGAGQAFRRFGHVVHSRYEPYCYYRRAAELGRYAELGRRAQSERGRLNAQSACGLAFLGDAPRENQSAAPHF
ncbi:MAG: hypothetical protein LBT62_08035, partial [Deltaproteobacteria bacterium]|nr:hypothetical protein [Deltaproteobacteria bacterium]